MRRLAGRLAAVSEEAGPAGNGSALFTWSLAGSTGQKPRWPVTLPVVGGLRRDFHGFPDCRCEKDGTCM